ncbi:MAG: dihydrofolate reductase family protein, partial [Yaniella sp.]
KLHSYGIKRLMVGGGGVINWSLMQNKLVDEVSVILAPIANGDPSAARFFTAREPYTTVEDMAFDLAHLEHLGDGVVWLRYTPKS